MPKFKPSVLIQDCWSSIGDITFYHRNGKCFWRRKPKPTFPGTSAQLSQQQIHFRAIAAWQHLQHSVQLQWNEYARVVPSHRPPYNEQHHISGFNLFVSAYHGFAQLGREHVPEPQPFPQFPPSALELLQITHSGGIATLRCHLALAVNVHPERWHVSARIQLAPPGAGYDPGKMRSYIGSRNSNNVILFNVPVSGNEEFNVHIRYRLIDEITGYRNNWHNVST